MQGPKPNRLFILFLILLPLVTTLFTLLYQKYMDTSEQVFSIIYQKTIASKEQQFNNVIRNLEDYGGEVITHLKNNEAARSTLERELSLLLTDDIKYLYILYRDEKGKLRYLVDTVSDPEERGEFGQKFDPQTDAWEQAYESKTVQIRQQDMIDALWISYVQPIIINEQVIALLGADFSNAELKRITEAINPINELALQVTFFLVILLFIGYIQLFLYYRSRQKSFRDPLTQLYNLAYFYEVQKNLPLHEYQLLMIDIDHFKEVNNAYGHGVGDRVLHAIARRLQASIRSEDLLLRYSGEEFLLLYHKQNSEHCIKTAEKILANIRSEPVIVNGQYIYLTVSIGINPVPEASASYEEALKIVDEQLVQAKQNGRNRYESYTLHSHRPAVLQQQLHEAKLALKEGRINCLYQPVYQADTLALHSYEILVRLNDHNGNMIKPETFLDAIRPTEQYLSITGFVLERAIELLKQEPCCVSFNLHANDLYNEPLVQMIEHAIDRNQSLSDRLIIEISDCEALEDTVYIKQQLGRFKHFGTKIALDDFGNGYANFKHMLHIGIDILKLDGSIIRGIRHNDNRYNFVRTIYSFAKEMGISTVAEAVESEEEMLSIREIGIEYIQGHYLCEPLKTPAS